MMTKTFALVALLASPAAAHAADAIGLGVGAAASNVAIVRIEGQPTEIALAGVPAGNESARAFLQCLLASRVVRVDREHGRVTMLDGNSANDHVLEFLQTKTKVDPCALGKAAYTPRGAAPAAAPPPATAAASGDEPPASIDPVVTSEPLPQPAAKPAAKKKSAAKKKKH